MAAAKRGVDVSVFTCTGHTVEGTRQQKEHDNQVMCNIFGKNALQVK